MFPPVPQEMVDAGYRDFADRWNPILDVFDEVGVRFAHEVHPSEIAYDYWTTVRTLEAIGHRPAFGLNWDPSHFVWQDLDPVGFLWDFRDLIYHVDCKDAKRQVGNGRNGRLGSHLPWADPRRGWDFVSTGRGDVPWEACFRMLNTIGYDGPDLRRVGGRRDGPARRRTGGAGVRPAQRVRGARPQRSTPRSARATDHRSTLGSPVARPSGPRHRRRWPVRQGSVGGTAGRDLDRAWSAGYRASQPDSGGGVTMPDPRVDEFHRLHAAGCFVMPNPWDARERAGPRARSASRRSRRRAPASRGRSVAPTRGSRSTRRSSTCASSRAAVSVPVNADFEGGFAVEPDQVARERDASPQRRESPGCRSRTRRATTASPLYRVRPGRRARARRAAGDRRERDRTSCSPAAPRASSCGRPDIDETIRRLGRTRTPAPTASTRRGSPTPSTIAAIVAAVSPKPVNLLVNAPVHDGARGGGARRAADQRRRHARADGVGRVPRRPPTRSPPTGRSPSFEGLPNVDALWSAGTTDAGAR